MARFIDRNSKTIFIEILGEREQYDYVHMNEFTSARKMMSVIVKNVDTQEMTIFAKGSDTSIRQRSNKDMQTNNDIMDYNFANIFAREGLRTLAFACREILEGEVFEGS